ncbi:MAG: TIGR01777 family protein [Rhizobacter sp.]|nr:TIGR01777 family protein [Ferruginibacter sp.]
MSTILITGGTGMVGKALTRYLSLKGHHIIILSRTASQNKINDNVEFAEWNVEQQQIDIAAVQRADHIIHLAGASVFAKRWTTAYKKEIEESRTLSSRLLANTLRDHSNQVKTVVSSSAIGWYGADKIPGHYFIEEEPADSDFLGRTCAVWEQSIEPATQSGVRLVILRTGIVLSNGDGFLAPIQQGLRFGMATITGSGKQVVSWIHIDDLCRMFLYAIDNGLMNGAFNAVATHPVTMKALVLKEAALKKGNFFIPLHVPDFALKMVLGERSIEALKSTTVSNNKIKDRGFTFLHPTIDGALESLNNEK